MNNEELDFVENILNAYDNDNDTSTVYRSINEIKDRREEALYYLYEKYLNSEKNVKNFQRYLSSLEGYEYVENPSQVQVGDYIRYAKLDDLMDIKLVHGGIVTKTEIIYNEKEYSHLLELNSACRHLVRNKDNLEYKKIIWRVRKDAIIFRRLNQDDKLNASIMEMFGEFL